jgi:hypothetical protein
VVHFDKLERALREWVFEAVARLSSGPEPDTSYDLRRWQRDTDGIFRERERLVAVWRHTERKALQGLPSWRGGMVKSCGLPVRLITRRPPSGWSAWSPPCWVCRPGRQGRVLLGLLCDPAGNGGDIDRAAGVDLQDRAAEAEWAHPAVQRRRELVVQDVIDVAWVAGGVLVG